jgi:hypothetical protein
MRPTGGTITDTNKPGVRRVLNLEVAGGHDLFANLAPFGTELTVTCRVTYNDRTTLTIPMGVFDIDSDSLVEGQGKITVTAPDKWVRIQRAKFLAADGFDDRAVGGAADRGPDPRRSGRR